MTLICTAGRIYLLAIFGRILMSWFPVSPGGVAAQIFGFLYNVTEPVLGPLRRAIPPVRMGAMGLDLSPIIVVIGLEILLGALGCPAGRFL